MASTTKQSREQDEVGEQQWWEQFGRGKGDVDYFGNPDEDAIPTITHKTTPATHWQDTAWYKEYGNGI